MIEFQRLILGDTVRNSVFTEALRRTVKAGDTVADIGSGTGFLGFVASRLGAKRCHLYEMDPDALTLSKKIAKQSKIDNCAFHGGHSAAVKTPPQVDVLVSETLGNYALEENILETLQDARRFLKPGGVMIPQTLTQLVSPVTASRLRDALDVWDVGHGLDYRCAREVSLNNVYVRTVQKQDLSEDLPARTWDEIDFREDTSSDRQASVEWTVGAPRTVYGFALWWACSLLPGLSISTAPDAPQTHWEQLFLPLLEPMAVAAGETLVCRLHSDTHYEVKVRLRWEAAIKGKDGKQRARQEMDMKKGQVA